jgi:hypothetical protein
MSSADLVNRPADVTRSTIQKALVVLATKPVFGPIREKLGVVTRAWFLQHDFEVQKTRPAPPEFHVSFLYSGSLLRDKEREILREFYESLTQNFKDGIDDGELYMGLSPPR